MGNTVKDILKKPSLLFMTFGHWGFFNWMSDEQYLRIAYKIKLGKNLNLENPETFNEKLQWLKLYDRRPEYTMMVDKFEVKKYVSDIIGEEYVIPTLGVYNSFEEINFDALPNKFVLKCTHDSGGIVICKDKSSFNKKKVKSKLEKCLKHNFYWGFREWPYKNVKPRIIAEVYMSDTKQSGLIDYKFFCFDGEIKSMYIATERFNSTDETKFDFYDADFNHLPFTNGHPNANIMPSRPDNFELMKDIASKLSRNIPHVRVDFYEVDGKVYFGEMTFFHWSGLKPFVPEEWDMTFGSWIELNKIKI